MGEPYIILTAVFASTCIFGVGGRCAIGLVRILVSGGRSSMQLVAWYRSHRELRRQRDCYGILARFSSALDPKTQSHDYFTFLIDSGIRPHALRNILEENTRHARQFDFEKRFQVVFQNAQARARVQEFASRQEALLAEGEVHLERLRHQRAVLGGLFQKIRTKYEV